MTPYQHVSTETLIQWMNTLRFYQHDPVQRDRLLECFWDSQIRSKAWLINQVQTALSGIFPFNSAAIYGGWYGVLGQMFKEISPQLRVVSIDIDPQCAIVGAFMNPRVEFITGDMRDVLPPTNTSMIINTSTEHVEQDVYDQWLANMPKGVPIVLQSNDFFSCHEHVRCASTIEEFKEQAQLTHIVYEGALSCTLYNRFMIIGYKK